MLNKRFSALHLILAALAAALLTGGGLFLALYQSVGSEGLAILQGTSLARQVFVGDYDPDAAAEGALDGLVDSLGDRWSHYLTAEEYQAQNQTRSNAYVGIGVTVNRTDERGLYVVSVEPEGPAAQAGLLPGEIITAVDGRSAAGDDQEEVIDSISGQEGTQVELTVLSQEGSTRTVTVTRANIQSSPVVWEMLDGNVGLITIRNFYTNAASTFQEAVEALTSQGASALVLDVRNDPGGYVSELTQMLDTLLPEGVIFRTTDWQGNASQVESDAACVELPIVTIVNADTYSAAEFFAAELQEQGVAVIVGEPTSGKGYSQQTFALPHGGAMAISTGAYFTGSGTSLIGTGLTLDREVYLTDEGDAQLEAALDLLEQN